MPVAFIHSWYREPLFIESWVEEIRGDSFDEGAFYLFSAHSLPMRYCRRAVPAADRGNRCAGRRAGRHRKPCPRMAEHPDERGGALDNPDRRGADRRNRRRRFQTPRPGPDRIYRRPHRDALRHRHHPPAVRAGKGALLPAHPFPQCRCAIHQGPEGDRNQGEPSEKSSPRRSRGPVISRLTRMNDSRP